MTKGEYRCSTTAANPTERYVGYEESYSQIQRKWYEDKGKTQNASNIARSAHINHYGEQSVSHGRRKDSRLHRQGR